MVVNNSGNDDDLRITPGKDPLSVVRPPEAREPDGPAKVKSRSGSGEDGQFKTTLVTPDLNPDNDVETTIPSIGEKDPGTDKPSITSTPTNSGDMMDDSGIDTKWIVAGIVALVVILSGGDR